MLENLTLIDIEKELSNKLKECELVSDLRLTYQDFCILINSLISCTKKTRYRYSFLSVYYMRSILNACNLFFIKKLLKPKKYYAIYIKKVKGG